MVSLLDGQQPKQDVRIVLPDQGGLDLFQDGHLTHGSEFNISGHLPSLGDLTQ